MFINILNNTPDQILDMLNNIICLSKSIINGIIEAPAYLPDKLNDDAYIISSLSSQLSFLLNVSTDEHVIKTCQIASNLLNAHSTEKQLNHELYKAIVNYTETQNLDSLTKRYLNRLIIYYERNGINLPKPEREAVKKLFNKINDLETTFEMNINKVETTLKLTKKELSGLDESILKTLSKEGDYYLVDLKYPTYKSAMRQIENANIRKKLEYAFDTRCKEINTALLIELIVLRDQLAQKLGFDTYADYATQLQMAKNPRAIKKMLLKVLADTNDKYRANSQLLSKLKKSEENTEVINSWDVSYYAEKLREQMYGDIANIIDKLPVEKVLNSLFELFSKLYQIEFITQKHSPFWQSADPAILFYEVKKNNQILGSIYLDLYPRKNKFSHAACFTIFMGCNFDDKPHLPIACIVANFSQQYWKHQEMSTLYHEFGHALNQMFARTKYCLFSGFNLELDFIEAPSQIFENWCDEAEILHKILPDVAYDTLKQVREMSKLNNAIRYRRQCCLSLFDQFIHSDKQFINYLEKNKEPKSLYILHEKFVSDIMYLEKYNEGTFMPSSWGHLVGGYDARYYSYLWSNMIALTMFYSKFEGHLLDPAVGKEYIDKILEVGGRKDAIDELSDFLGKRYKLETGVENLMKMIP